VAGAGAPRSSGERPPSGGGGGRGVASARALSRARCPGNQATSSSIAPVPRSAGSRPGRRERCSRRVSAPPARSLTGQRPGGRMSLPGYREDLVLQPATIRCPGRRCRTRLRLPGGSARCTRASRRWVEARTVVRHVGRRPGVRRRRGARAADVGLQAESSARNRVVGRGHPGKKATGLGVLEVERRTASGGWLPWSRICIRSGAGMHLSRRRRAGPTGTSSARSSGTWIVAPARGIRGPDWTADHRGPGPGR
jgi:hypothetical protein